MALTELSRKAITDKIGELVLYQGSDPAAGAEWSEVVPARKTWRVRAVNAQLVTDATVANRVARLIVDDGAGNIIAQIGPGMNHVASTSVRYSVAEGDKGDALGSTAHWPVVDLLDLSPGFRIRSLTANIVVGDNWGPPAFLVEEITV